MSGNILELAREHMRLFTTKGGFSVDIKLTTPDGNTIVDVTGLATKHWNSIDTDGLPTNSKNAHINVNEYDLSELGYPVRNANQEINLYGHLVSVKDSSGVLKNYQVVENRPSETFGSIVLILGDYLNG